MRRAKILRIRNETRRVTIRKLLDAMEENNYEQTFGRFADVSIFTGAEVQQACALGQAGLNLGIQPEDLHRSLSTVSKRHGLYWDLARYIFSRNDSDRQPVSEIARALREGDFKDVLNSRVSGRIMDLRITNE